MLTAVLALSVMGQATEPGLSLRLYDIRRRMQSLPLLVAGQTPNVDELVEKVDFSTGGFFGFTDRFYVEITGEVYAPTAGTYAFQVTSDDGSILKIGDNEVVSSNGVHSAQPKSGEVTLKEGWHPIHLRYFENDGQEALRLEWKRPGEAGFEVLSNRFTRVPKGLTRVVSPGAKRALGLGGPVRPGSGMPLAGLHPGLDIMTVRPEDFKPKVGSMAFLPDGTLLVATFDPNQGGQFKPNLRDGAIYALTGVTGNDRSAIKVRRVAKDLQEPLGMAVVDGTVYLSLRNEIAKLVDADGDGEYEKTETVGSGWTTDNYHHFTFGLVPHDGWLYASLSTSITFGAPGINGPNPPFRGSVFRVDPKRYDPKLTLSNIEFLTGGHRTPNGLVALPTGEILVGENQGAWQPANKLNEVKLGGFYGHYNNTAFKTREYPGGGVRGLYDHHPLERPAVTLPQGEAGNSPSESTVIPEGKPFAGQILTGDVKYGGLHRIFLERVDGVLQGGMVHFTQGFESGINRMTWGPDGALYLGGIGASETWGWTDPKTGKETTFGLQRIKFNGKQAFEIESVKAMPDGFTVNFTKPGQALADVSRWTVKQWEYKPTPEYGGDKVNEEVLTVKRVFVARDGKSARIVVPGLKEGRVVYIDANLMARDREPLWSTEVWYNLNAIPGKKKSPAPKKPIRMLAFTKTSGFRHDSIPVAQRTLMRLSSDVRVDVTEDANQFNPTNLKQYDVVAFVMTTGDVLDAAQEKAFEDWVRAGGGYLGVHSAADTEYEWPFYGELVGAYFKSHPAIQAGQVVLEDQEHPTTRVLPNVWHRVDEWYDYRATPRGKVRVLARLLEDTYRGGTMGRDHPIMWCREMGKGRSWYTGMGHTQGSWSESLFLQSLRDAIDWLARR
jgi:type 1 glutamine amidotransferase